MSLFLDGERSCTIQLLSLSGLWRVGTRHISTDFRLTLTFNVPARRVWLKNVAKSQWILTRQITSGFRLVKDSAVISVSFVTTKTYIDSYSSHSKIRYSFTVLFLVFYVTEKGYCYHTTRLPVSTRPILYQLQTIHNQTFVIIQNK